MTDTDSDFEIDPCVRVLEIGRNVLKSLEDQQLLKDNLHGSIKEMINLMDQPSFRVEKVETELSELSTALMKHPKMTVEAAIAAGSVKFKIVLLAGRDDRQIVQECKDRVDELSRSEEDNFEMIITIFGILNCGGPKAKKILGSLSYLSSLLPHILKSCSVSVADSYLSFVALKTWSNRLRELPPGETVQARSDLVASCIRMVTSNWENPRRGTSDLVEEVLSNVLDACAKSCVEDYEELLKNLWNSNLNDVSWLSKSKYPPMTVLLPRIGVDKVLEENPDFGINLSQSFSSNHLSMAAATVYRLVLKKIDLTIWKQKFLEPLLSAVISDSSLIRNNALNHWIPSTIKTLSGSSELMMSALAKNESDHAWVVRCIILKQGRLLKSDEITNDQMAMLDEALVHSSSSVRISAFSVLCHQKKKGEAPSSDEMTKIGHFIGENLTVDSPSFRQEFLSDFTSLTIRCRNFCVANLKKNVAVVEAIVQHLDDLTKKLINNLFPGANYQRLITALEFLRIICLCFHNYEPGGINKSCANSDPKALLQYAQVGWGLLYFYNDDNLSKLLTCVLHYMVDVRTVAAELLMKFSPSREMLPEVLRKGFKLICSPKYGLCESGATLFKLCQNWTSGRQDLIEILRSIDFNSGDQNPFLAEIFCKSLAVFPSQYDAILPNFLLGMYEILFEQLGTNFIHLARHAPMHGILTAIRFCLDAGCRITTDFAQKLNRTLKQTTRTMLALLSGRRSTDQDLVNASFADMGLAIAGLLKSDVDNNEDDEELVADENISISDDHGLALAFTWINLKSSALLAAALVVNFGHQMSPEEIEISGDVMFMILRLCRQKGAIEGASLALADFATCLMIDPRIQPESRKIPEKMLISVLDSLETETNVSVTRRSAGLPIIVTRIVVSEPRSAGQSRRLLSLAISRLLMIARGAEVVGSSEHEDSGQAHALHILRSLVHDGGLSQEIGLHISDILQACVEKFNSRSWAVRNASLQLFGALVPRLLGQKKVRTDDTSHNVILFHEFFSRFFHLKSCLLQSLKTVAESCLVSPGVVPLLSLLSRVAHGGDGFGVDDNQTIKDFKNAFMAFFGSSVINVRRLSAKAYANFTPRSEMLTELESLMTDCINSKRSTNQVNGYLTCIQEIILLMKSERRTLFDSNVDKVKSIAKNIVGNLNLECYILKIQVCEICKLIGTDDQLMEGKSILCAQNYHPGFSEWLLMQTRLEIDVDDLEDDVHFVLQSRQEGFKMIQYLVNPDSALPPCRAIYLLKRFVESNLDRQVLTGVMIETCNDFFCSQSDVIINDSELVLDLLDVPTSQTIVSEKFGLGARTSSLIVASICFAGMLIQPDYKMFFDGGGPFVTLFSEHCDTLLRLSTPKNLETSRLNVAKALIKMLPALNQRKICEELDLHMRYAICQAINAAFTLLSDEDADIRAEVTCFVSKLDSKNTKELLLLPFSRYPNLSSEKAAQKLFVFALSELNECAEWLESIVDLFFAHWNDKDALEKILSRNQRQVLFESGEGLNVYEEVVSNNKMYFDTFNVWAKASLDQKPIKLNLQPGCWQSTIFNLVELCKLQNGPFSELRTPPGYLLLVRCLNFLNLVGAFPNIFYGKSVLDEKVSEMIFELKRHTYF